MNYTTPMDHVRKNCPYGSLDKKNKIVKDCSCSESKVLYKGEYDKADQHPFWEPLITQRSKKIAK